MNRKAFYAGVRSSLFSGTLDQGQVTGIEALLDEWDAGGYTDPRWLAYILATSHHETGAKFVASIENLNYSVDGLLKTFGRHRISANDAKRFGRTPDRAADQKAIANLIYGGEWGRENLGNTQSGDGWLYRGRGFPQITGRANYEKFGVASNPDSAAETLTAAKITVDGMVGGKFTGLKLSTFFNASKDNAVGARQIVNPDANGAKIAGIHKWYLAAVKAAA